MFTHYIMLVVSLVDVDLHGVVEDGGDLDNLFYSIPISLVQLFSVELDVSLGGHELHHRSDKYDTVL